MKNKESANPKSKDFDWLLFLNKPVEEVKQKDVELAHKLSGDWPTCACGQLCKSLPRGQGNMPEDDVLYELGIQFADVMEEYDCAAYAYHSGIVLGLTNQEVYKRKVANAKRKKALAIFNKIEKRTIKLLSKIK
jgi:hypothetical protein